MGWSDAKTRISSRVRVGDDLNTPDSTFREVWEIGPIRDSDSYGYHSENGFVVRIGAVNSIAIPWSMLERCFDALKTDSGYDGHFFRSLFKLQAKHHPCHVHVVGQIFVRSGLARRVGSRYYLRSTAECSATAKRSVWSPGHA